jgi:hypothetical protein
MLGLEVNGLFRHIWADGQDVTMNVWDGWMDGVTSYYGTMTRSSPF